MRTCRLTATSPAVAIDYGDHPIALADYGPIHCQWAWVTYSEGMEGGPSHTRLRCRVCRAEIVVGQDAARFVNWHRGIAVDPEQRCGGR